MHSLRPWVTTSSGTRSYARATTGIGRVSASERGRVNEGQRSSRRYVTIEEVYRRYGEDLLRFLHGGCPHLNHQDCEDLLHQAVLKAVARIDQYDPARGSLRLWVFGILRNEVRMDVRARRRRRTELTGEVEDLVPGSDPPAADAAAVAQDELRAVETALQEVPFAEREALLAPLRTEGAATTDEIARRLGIAPGSVAVYRQRARERLRAALAKHDDESRGGGPWLIRPPGRDPIRTGASTR
jgi:RNA polymerase sigma factor (sigma-70 family)